MSVAATFAGQLLVPILAALATRRALTGTRPGGHTVATIWPQLQLTHVNYCAAFSQLEALSAL
jgi:hypothetical protein